MFKHTKPLKIHKEDYKKMVQSSIKDNSKTISIKSIEGKISKTKYQQFQLYTEYAESQIRKLDVNQLEEYLKTISDKDKQFLVNNAIYEKDLKLTEMKNSHNLDNRTPEELLCNLIVHNIMEEIVVLESFNTKHPLIHNPVASKEDLLNQNSQPDHVFADKRLDNILLEQQTSVKKYSKIYTKEHKLSKLRIESVRTGKDIYILQKYVQDRDNTLYALVNVNDDFVLSERQLSNDTMKRSVETVNRVHYRSLESIVNQLATKELKKTKVEEKNTEINLENFKEVNSSDFEQRMQEAINKSLAFNQSDRKAKTYER